MISKTEQNADVLSKPEAWNGFSHTYQTRIGTCTMHGTSRLVEILANEAPFNSHSYVHDNGTGGGSIARAIKERYPTTKILATDISPGMLKQVDSADLPGVTTQLVDAVTQAGLDDNTFTHSLTSFAIQFTPDMLATVQSMHRTLKPGGVVGFANWGAGTCVDIVHDAAGKRLDPSYQKLSVYPAGAWNSEQEQRDAMTKVGFKDVKTLSMNMPFAFESAEDYAHWYFGPFGNPVAAKLLADWKKHGGDLEELKFAVQDVVREQYDDGKGLAMEAVLAWGTK
ncbi:hypothetical protein MBLNU457_6160t1 [Dothideomycetes sp. NU457]